MSTGAPVNNAVVEIINTSVIDQSTIVGEYATGYATAGTYDVVYSHPQYLTDTVYGVPLVNGVVYNQDVQLIPLQGFSFTVSSEDLLSVSVPGVQIVIENSDFSFTGQTNANGQIVFNSFYPGTYSVFAGKWGFQEYCSTAEFFDGTSTTYVVQLEEGYADLFNLDLGWTVSGAAPDGVWERANPIGTTFQGNQCNPEDDGQDCGNKAYVTGNAGGGAGADDVDQASTILTSPSMNLTTAPNLVWTLTMELWWFNSGGNGNVDPNDTLRVSLTDGINTTTVLEYYSDDSGMQWVPVSTTVDPSLVDISNLSVVVSTADWQAAAGHLVEAGIDNFKMTNNTAVESSSSLEVSVYPNPSRGIFMLSNPSLIESYELFDISGKRIESSRLTDSSIHIRNKGAYVLVLRGINGSSTTSKIVVY